MVWGDIVHHGGDSMVEGVALHAPSESKERRMLVPSRLLLSFWFVQSGSPEDTVGQYFSLTEWDFLSSANPPDNTHRFVSLVIPNPM